MTLIFHIQGKPIVGQRARKGRGGHWYDPQAAEKQVVGGIALAALKRAVGWQGNGGDGLGCNYLGPVGLTLRISGMRSNSDLSNCLKFYEDAMNKIIWYDDCQIVEEHLYRVDGEPGITIEVWTVPT